MSRFERIIREIAVPKAIEKAQREGLRNGQVVAHSSEKISYYLKEIRGDIAVVWLGSEDSKKELPINELFDPNDAKFFALEELHRVSVKDHENRDRN